MKTSFAFSNFDQSRYEVHSDDTGRVEKIVGHSTNSGFSGEKYV